ncbi:hypothetical protein BCR34DRAFT_650299 [Clohesyomyces aquaticus]|uniref:Uncharacterized protein n=1 Tax=Clohesyomyces aquaticus TaxID=1231657 RepID=A0A1Y1ZQZ6_9PLEO|nr:hypothetical protein BCR34DRAFT_650299 [Clohesyomyces aquaticus]
MPLTFVLAVPGSHRCFLASTPRAALLLPHGYSHFPAPAPCGRIAKCPGARWLHNSRPPATPGKKLRAKPWTYFSTQAKGTFRAGHCMKSGVFFAQAGFPRRSVDGRFLPRENHPVVAEEGATSSMVENVPTLGKEPRRPDDEGTGSREKPLTVEEPSSPNAGFLFPGASNNPAVSGRLWRKSRSEIVLDAIHGPVGELYHLPLHTKKPDWRSNLQPRGIGGRRRNNPHLPLPQPADLDYMATSLHTILARYITWQCTSTKDLEYQFRLQEIVVLRSHGYTSDHIELWANALLEKNSYVAANVFQSGLSAPPMFLVLLFLRRRKITARALGVVMRHVDNRLKAGGLDWTSTKILVIRLLRHARQVWAETIPWIASFFNKQARSICHEDLPHRRLNPKMRSDLTYFCNTVLSLISLPTSTRPILSSGHQQSAQFKVLKYMAECTPAIIVTRVGFRAVTRVQLAQPKTSQEREWAVLKGPSWPPWKVDRIALDEEKSYSFGQSRASRIMQSMFEAGYKPQLWDKVAEIYAGWDTDQSPTIQTRTSFPGLSTYRGGSRKRLVQLLWAARIRTTRTRREAWACFLAYENSKLHPHQEVYHAMFEKLVYPEYYAPPSDFDDAPVNEDPLPGDMKEALPDPASPKDLVYITESVPSYERLFHRMAGTDIKPTGRFLAFLLVNASDFELTLSFLKSERHQYRNGIARLLDGSALHRIPTREVPEYILTAFVRFLCHFGRFPRRPDDITIPLTPEEHEDKLRTDRPYLLDYAYRILTRFQPRYHPAWTAYIERLVYRSSKRRTALATYTTFCSLLDKMRSVDLDIDEEQFSLFCTVVFDAATQIARSNSLGADALLFLSNAPLECRTLFQILVGGGRGSSPVDKSHSESRIPPPLLSPSTLHAYTRALSILGDYEGMYSFSTWATTHREEVTARINAQAGGPAMWRKTLVALRAGLENTDGSGEPAPRELRELVMRQVEGVQEWGGWPSKKEVDGYLARWRSGGLRS